MRHKLLTILLCGFMILGIISCGNSKNEFDVGRKSEIQILNNDISLSIKNDTLKNTGVTLILKNNSNKLLRYDEVYEIEIKQNNEWHKINVILNFNEPLWSLESNASEELEFLWENSYGKLAKGEYRIIKEVYFENEYEQKFYISAEFFNL